MLITHKCSSTPTMEMRRVSLHGERHGQPAECRTCFAKPSFCVIILYKGTCTDFGKENILVFPIELKFQLFLAIEQRYLPTHHHSKIGKLPPAKQLEIFYPLKSIRFGSYKITVTCTC